MRLPPAARRLATAASERFVRIVEVGPRDGLQNEKTVVPRAVKVELIDRLGAAGLSAIEAGSFVSPKWVPQARRWWTRDPAYLAAAQMADTAGVLTDMRRAPGAAYPVLVPNDKGLQALLASPARTDEIAVFTAASEGFSRANTNCSIAESLARLEHVVRAARDAGLRVRGYVSTVIACPFDGAVAAARVRDVAAALADMGCYEVSLGDTTGAGTPRTMLAMLDGVVQRVRVEMLAAHNHDTFGMGISNIMAAISAGVRTVDSSVAGLGGCPYSPGATGNVATEDVVHALEGDGWHTGVDMGKLVETGEWISRTLHRPNESRAGRAWLARREREARKQEQAQSN